MSEIGKRKRGRPKKDSSNRIPYRLRMSDDMKSRLDNLSRITGKTRADIFREAFNIYENLQKTKLPDDDFKDFDGDFD